MKRKHTLLITLFGMLALLGVLAACGGGGGGGGTSIPDSYDGVTKQAVITVDNAIPIVQNAWELLIAGRDIGEGINDGDAAAPASVPMSLAMEKVPRLSAEKGQVTTQATVTDSGTIFGGCGGVANYTISVDDATGSFTGQISFVNYCEDGVILNGITGFSGKIDLNALVMTSFKLTFDDLDVTDGTEWYTFTEGSVAYNLNSDMSGETDTLGFVVRDNKTDKSYWLNKCVIKFTYSYPEDQATISGRYYDYDYGYVDISTLATLLIPDTVWPTAGVVLFTGNASKARLTFNADESALLELDANNDGTFETSLGDPFVE